MESSDRQQNEIAAVQFQDRVGNRSPYYARLVDQAEARREVEESYDRSRFWFAVRVSLACIATTGVGFLIMGWAMHTTDAEKGRVMWILGPIIGNLLTLVVIAWAAVKWERDDW
jgi:hypothetical protein